MASGRRAVIAGPAAIDPRERARWVERVGWVEVRDPRTVVNVFC